MIWPPPVTLAGQHVTLEPLAQSHAADLVTAARALGHLWYTSIPKPEDIPAEIDARTATPDMCAFAQIDATGTAVGMTTYLHTSKADRRVEIGATWLAPQAQRGPLNSEAKLLLLTHAFETLDCVRVEFRTHRLNHQSRRAIERLGAQLEGILRNHMVMPDGHLRDTAVYAIIANEWPVIKQHLTAKLS
ncbi:MAG: GNAT family protein [Pseudomonadota bacterium]